jgi:hypothetical protein
MKSITIAVITLALLLLGALVANAQTTYLNDNCSSTGHWLEVDDATNSATVTSNGSTITLSGENNNGSDYQVAIEYRNDIGNPIATVADVFPTNGDNGNISFDIVDQPSAGQLKVSLFLFWVSDSCEIYDMPVSVTQSSVDTIMNITGDELSGTTFTMDLSSTHIQAQIDAAYTYAQIIYGGGVEEPEAFLLKISWESSTGSGSTFELDNIRYQGDAALAITPSTCSTADELNGSGALPVTLSYFRASLNEDKDVMLNWETVLEIDNSHFEVQRSTDGINFIKTAEVEGKGNSTSLINYNYVDYNAPQGITYYRLKQVDYDGDFEYSTVLHIKKLAPRSSTYFVLETSSGMEKITLPGFTADMPLTLLITDMGGSIIKNLSFEDSKSYALPSQFTHGLYIVTFLQGGERISKKLVL